MKNHLALGGVVQWGPKSSFGGMGTHHPLLGGWEIMDFWVFWGFFGGFWSKNQKTMVTNHGYLIINHC